MTEEEKKAIELLEEFIKYYEAESTLRKFRGTLSIRVDEDDIDALENLINMYKRVLKENEELKQDRKNNYQMIALSQRGSIRIYARI